MDDIFLTQVLETQENVSYDGDCFLFLIKLFLSKFRLEIALVAQFCNDVAVSIAGENFVAAQDVGMIKLFEDFDFGKEQFFKFFGFE